MGKFFKIIIGLIVIIVLILAILFFTGGAFKAVISLNKPKHDFDLAMKVPAPDYADEVNWAALPTTQDLADMIPAGIPDTDIRGSAPVDVFFIHPTGYLRGGDWNSSMDPDSATEENTQWMLANQASAYNGCCNVYAPRYREASIFAYLVMDETLMNQSLDFAYEDVERAFDYFLEHHSKGRPFIIASHSQGTQHARTLLSKRIDGTALRDRMITAYLIGGGVTVKQVESMETLEPCREVSDLHCVIHWETYGEGGKHDGWHGPDELLCTNPISWNIDGERAGPEGHQGAVTPSGDFNIKIWGEDKAEGVEFEPLGEPDPNHTWAQCTDGVLYVAEQKGGKYERYGRMPGKNYHGLDYALFFMDIRENAKLRVDAYLARGETEGHLEVNE